MILIIPMLAVSVLLAYLLLRELNKEEKRKQRRGKTTPNWALSPAHCPCPDGGATHHWPLYSITELKMRTTLGVVFHAKSAEM